MSTENIESSEEGSAVELQEIPDMETFGDEEPLVQPHTKHRKNSIKENLIWFTLGGLISALFMTIFVIIVMFPAFDKHNEDNTSDSYETLKQLSELVLQDMNLNIDPCEDFYEYSCGSWISRTELPTTEYRWTRSFDVVYDQNKQLMLDKIQEQWPIVSSFYRSCEDLAEIEISDSDIIIKDILNSVYETTTQNDLFDKLAIIKKEQGMDTNPFFYAYVEVNAYSPDRYIASVWQKGILLPDPGYYDESENFIDLDAYAVWIYDMFSAIDIILSDKELKDIVDFEKQLAKLLIPSVDLRDPYLVTNNFNISEAENILGSAVRTYLKQWLPSLDEINIAQFDYFTEIATLLDSNQLNLNTTKNVAALHILFQSYPIMPYTYREVVTRYDLLVYGTEDSYDVEATCIDLTHSMLPFLLGHYYVDAAFSEEAKNETLNLVNEIEFSMDNILMQSTWMDVTTISEARNKLSLITNQIGYPDEWIDQSLLFGEYGFYISDKDLFGNYFNICRTYYMEEIKLLDQAVDKTTWYSSPAVVNAWYSPNLNQITFPAGIIQAPFFSKNNPKAYNYGGLGVVVGHEITHGFDDQGRQYDGLGYLSNWWSDTSLYEFIEATECVANAYSEYEIQPGLQLDGYLTLGENIADMGGIRQAFDALQRYKTEQPEASELEDEYIKELFDMTQDQLFFVSFAQVWCEKTTAEYDLLMASTNPHSPGKFRVQGTLSNYDEFAETFSCSATSVYNPDKKCRVW